MEALSALLILGALAVWCYLIYRLVQNKRGKPDRGPRKRVLAVGALLAFIVGVAVTPAQDSETAGERDAATQSTTSTTAPSSAVKTIQDAEELVDDDDFPAALAIAAVLGGEAERSVRGRISNRIAQRVRSALRNGNRAGARRLLASSKDYPSTGALVAARADLRGAERRVSARRKAATAQRAAAAAERKRQREAAAAEPEVPEAGADAPSGNCSDIAATDFPVPRGDPRDRDNDGIACES